jgi:hypothetical protein
MPASATHIFEFLQNRPSFSNERHELSLAEFGVLRRSLRSIVVNLRDGGDQEGSEISERLRNHLSEWLTVPIKFDETMLSALQSFGAPSDVEARWGRDIRVQFDSALQAAQTLQSIDNPVRARLQTVIRELRNTGRIFKIYCHPRARQHFESLLLLPDDAPLELNAFMHSVRDYHEANTFDTLIKVGPLRSWGWGAAPDAIKTAPRFGSLIQIVWAGCSDEPSFGYDPVAPCTDGTTPSPMRGSDSSANGSPILWTPCRIQIGNDDDSVVSQGPMEDEFQVFDRLNQIGQKRRATLVHVDDSQGILYPPLCKVISFDSNPSTREPIARRLPGDTLLDGMYLIRPILADLDLGGVRAEHGHYSQTWKTRLRQQLQTDAPGLVARLRAAGINLVHLLAAVETWCGPPTTVIHAPQQIKHFEMLIQVLGLNGDATNVARRKGRLPWWQIAWNEIRHSRGEAIQAGVYQQEIVEEQLMVVLEDLLPQIYEKAATNAGFHLHIPDGRDLKGGVLFFRVAAVEEGFLVPETELKIVCDLDTIEQWRA